MGEIINLEATSAEIMHSMRLSFRQRFSIFNATGNYQFIKSKGAGAPMANTLPTDNYDLRAEWTRVFNRAVHNLSGTVNAQLPMGIFLAGTANYNDGRPYTITTGRDDNMDGQVNDRPPGVPRNSADGPMYFAMSFNVSKAFFLGGSTAQGGTRTNMNVFANINNAFNRANYNQPSGVMTSPNFGFATSSTDPREIEIGMRFQF
jgi:hypothetical protein